MVPVGRGGNDDININARNLGKTMKMIALLGQPPRRHIQKEKVIFMVQIFKERKGKRLSSLLLLLLLHGPIYTISMDGSAAFLCESIY